MSIKVMVALLFICGLVGYFLLLNPVFVLVLELSYDTFPVIVDGELQDIEFTWRADQYYTHAPPIQLMNGYAVVNGENKLSFFDLS